MQKPPIKAEKPELASPLPERVTALEEQMAAMAAVPPTVGQLQQEVTGLKEQLAEVLALLETGAQDAVRTGKTGPLHILPQAQMRPSGAEKRGYPPGTMRLGELVETHQLPPINQVKELHLEGKIIVDVYKRPNAQRNAREWWVTPDHHRAIIAFYQQQQKPCGRCELCADVSPDAEASA